MATKEFKCAFCGKAYDSIKDRASCELKCHEKEEKRIHDEKMEALRMEKDSRIKEIEKAKEKYYSLRKQFYLDYGYRYDYGTRSEMYTILF